MGLSKTQEMGAALNEFVRQYNLGVTEVTEIMVRHRGAFAVQRHIDYYSFDLMKGSEVYHFYCKTPESSLGGLEGWQVSQS